MFKLTFAILPLFFFISHAFLFLRPYCLLLCKWIFLQCNVLTPLMDVQAGFRKGRGTRDQIANICWIIKKARVPKEHLFLLIDYAKAFDCVNHSKLWKILKVMGIPDHLTCLLRNLYAGQETTVRTVHGKTDWFQIGKGVHQGCILIFTLLI